MSDKLTPEQFDKRVEDFFKNYQDRGMVKWGGFFLSDHKMKINQDKAKRQRIYPKKKEMSAEKISVALLKSFSEHRKVSVQLKDLDEDGNFAPDIVGFVQGYQDEDTINVSGCNVHLSDINHVDITPINNKIF